MLEVFLAALAAVYLYGRWALRRSERWQEAGLCMGCGAEGPEVEVGGNHYCEACSPAALKNSQLGGQFFAVSGAFLAIALSALLLEGGTKGSDEFLKSEIQVGVASIFAMALALWIHRRMKRKAGR